MVWTEWRSDGVDRVEIRCIASIRRWKVMDSPQSKAGGHRMQTARIIA